MDCDKFEAFLKKQRRSKGTIENCLRFSAEFEAYVKDNHGDKTLDNTTATDLETFIEWLKEQGKSPNSYLWGIGRYYEFSGNDEMRKYASGWRQRLISEGRRKQKGLSLRKIEGIDLDQVGKLSEIGVKDTTRLLEIGKTGLERKTLSRKTGIPESDILELVKLADLTRIVDIKAVRVRLLYEAGIDTIEALSQLDPEQLKVRLAKVNRKKKLMKRDPTLVETRYWITQAKGISKLVEL